MKGSNRPTAFLKSNFKLMGPGGVFRTVKSQFPQQLIRAEAARAGWAIRVEDEGKWLKVTVVGKAPKVKA